MIYTNYCRQFLHQYSDKGPTPVRNIKVDTAKAEVEDCIRIAKHSQKFMLPKGGVMHADNYLRALEHTKVARLPFKDIALEFYADPEDVPPVGKTYIPKYIFLMSEKEPDKLSSSSYIVCRTIVFAEHVKLWVLYSSIFFKTEGFFEGKTTDGRPLIRHGHTSPIPGTDVPQDEINSDLFIIFNFLNILQCQNVKAEKVAPKKSFTGQGKRNTLPFDSYHILTVSATPHTKSENIFVGGSHASPREHLRRGHIRMYESGKTIWVNATVVNPGNGGKVTKDYRYEL